MDQEIGFSHLLLSMVRGRFILVKHPQMPDMIDLDVVPMNEERIDLDLWLCRAKFL
jgi:hypothetical protein